MYKREDEVTDTAYLDFDEFSTETLKDVSEKYSYENDVVDSKMKEKFKYNSDEDDGSGGSDETNNVMNGKTTKKKFSETNVVNLEKLLLFDDKKNGNVISLKKPKTKTPLIVVKTVKDLNNVYKHKNGEINNDRNDEDRRKKYDVEEEKIKEYLMRNDTAVIYQEPVDQKVKDVFIVFLLGYFFVMC
ncbi:hypothetical protein Phum_PHUM017910 [Pediculus humanus corporis]|uniref:Uncharacterized protein n=1 Tax=Pediculus humanus subsp. corporis TaxID=121224 RepID=E0V9P8_PEDHC|nr:uncharacterized protein Phum_PHUM017910 [Pediculus humanus corporis]EEB10083.1 hypothetical protein Phum_PHUM017910 [Pediculus humanus corporis]